MEDPLSIIKVETEMKLSPIYCKVVEIESAKAGTRNIIFE
mgnify:CR=1 FL=1